MGTQGGQKGASESRELGYKQQGSRLGSRGRAVFQDSAAVLQQVLSALKLSSQPQSWFLNECLTVALRTSQELSVRLRRNFHFCFASLKVLQANLSE